MKAVKFIFILVVLIAIAQFCRAVDKPDVRMKTVEKSVVEGNNKFALELYAKLSGKEGNLFFSPYSISTALAMACAGARGSTEMQMARVMHYPVILSPGDESSSTIIPDREKFAGAFGKIIKDLNSRGEKGAYELRVANALWGQEGYEIVSDFIRVVSAQYGGECKQVDFVRATEAARKTINTWVEKKTENKIKDLIKPGVLNRMTRLVLTNAIYFKGNWARQFKKAGTRPGPFTLADGKKTDVPMMNQTEHFKYMETESFQALELPYVDNELSMIILLPKRTDGLGDIEKTLTAENFPKWLKKLHKRKVIVSVPKFKMTSQFSLASVLKSMGLTDAFVPDVADFSGMNGKRDLFISAVIHKAYVDVNEEGTEAAAATGVVIGVTSVMPDRPAVFRADHPFLFLIRDNISGGILFIGRMMEPKA